MQSNAPVQKTGLVNGIAASPDANCAIPISFTDSRTNGAYKLRSATIDVIRKPHVPRQFKFSTARK